MLWQAEPLATVTSLVSCLRVTMFDKLLRFHPLSFLVPRTGWNNVLNFLVIGEARSLVLVQMVLPGQVAAISSIVRLSLLVHLIE